METEEELPLSLDEGKRLPVWRGALESVVPALVWGRRYSWGAMLADLVAGVTLGLTLVPQSIAYAALADLPPQYGLYSSFVGTMVYVVLGSVKEVSIGPTSLMALLTLHTCHHLTIHHVVLLSFLAGAIVFLMGVLRLGFMVDLISPAVTNGFTSATALIICAAQLKGLLGLSFTAESLLDNLVLVTQHIRETRLGDTLLAVVSCVVLLCLRKLKDVPVSEKRPGLKKTLWLISIARNALVVTLASVIAYLTDHPTANSHPYFKLSGKVSAGLPSVSWPLLSLPATNGTAAVPFPQMVRQLGSGLVMLPLVMVLANIAIAKAFCSGRVDATQEMLTLGVCNMLGSLVQAMPACGAFTRSAVSHASGVRTPLAGLYAGSMTLLALAFMTEYFYYIPRACLSAVLVCAVVFMVDVSTPRLLWRQSRGDLAALLVTLLAGCLLSVEVALLAGCAVALWVPLRSVLRPPLTFRLVSGALVCRPAGVLVYVSADTVSATIASAARMAPPHTTILLVDCGRLALVDYSAIKVALLAGCAVALWVPLRSVLRPPLTFRLVSGALVCRPAGVLVYVSADTVSATIASAARMAPPHTTILLVDCGRLALVDYSAIKMLLDIRKKLESEGWTVWLLNSEGAALSHVPAGLTLRAATVSQALRHIAQCSQKPPEHEGTALLHKCASDSQDEQPSVTIQ